MRLRFVVEHAGRMSVAVEGLRPWQVAAVARLLDDGATVPFITRYRAANTGGLDEDQVRIGQQPFLAH